MVSRMVRGVAIAAGVAAAGGFGIGLAAGETADPADVPRARPLPTDLCKRLGELDSLFPGKVVLDQTIGTAEIRCQGEIAPGSTSTYSSAKLVVSITPYAPAPGETAADVAMKTFERGGGTTMPGRPYPTKIQRIAGNEESLDVAVLTIRSDIIVKVTYKASPVDPKAAEAAVLSIADKAIWETK